MSENHIEVFDQKIRKNNIKENIHVFTHENDRGRKRLSLCKWRPKVVILEKLTETN
jgi:hypothetical protein